MNYCTGAFPGSFSLKPETFTQVLYELFENLSGFGFEEVYCFNYHEDPVHIGSIIKAINRANNDLHMKVRFVIEAMDLELNGFTGDEDFLHVFSPQYKPKWFENMEQGTKAENKYQAVTNFTLFDNPTKTEFKKDRYENIPNTLEKQGGIISEEDALELLKSNVIPGEGV